MENGSNARIHYGKVANLQKSVSSIKGCLKKQHQDHRSSLDCEDQEIRSTKSIKFNIKHNDVFEYSHNDSRKKIILPKKTEFGSIPTS